MMTRARLHGRFRPRPSYLRRFILRHLESRSSPGLTTKRACVRLTHSLLIGYLRLPAATVSNHATQLSRDVGECSSAPIECAGSDVNRRCDTCSSAKSRLRVSSTISNLWPTRIPKREFRCPSDSKPRKSSRECDFRDAVRRTSRAQGAEHPERMSILKVLGPLKVPGTGSSHRVERHRDGPGDELVHQTQPAPIPDSSGAQWDQTRFYEEKTISMHPRSNSRSEAWGKAERSELVTRLEYIRAQHRTHSQIRRGFWQPIQTSLDMCFLLMKTTRCASEFVYSLSEELDSSSSSVE